VIAGLPRSPRFAAVACASLLGLAASMSTTACLITDTPSFEPPKHTKPFLDPITADPSVRDVVVIDSVDLATTSMSKTFSADVHSQDDPADSNGFFRQVQVRLHIDYGNPVAEGFASRFPISSPPLDPGGTLDQTGRRASVAWYPSVYPVGRGCHTATLMVSHHFQDVSGCPTCNDDYTAITWQILRCDSSIDPDDCKTLPLVVGEGGCPPPTTSCEKLNDGGACPASTTADGGAQ
jgi:hypothetical protein